MNAATPQRRNAATPQRRNAATPLRCFAAMLLLVLFAAGCSNSNSLASPQQASRSNVDADESSRLEEMQTWDFGVVLPGTELSHSFKITNTTNETLHFKELIRSCRCTSCELSSQSIEPNCSIDATVLVNAPEGVGDLATTAEVVFAPRALHVGLRTKAMLRRVLSALPSAIDFGDVKCGSSPLAKELRIESRLKGSSELAILDQPDWCEAKLLDQPDSALNSDCRKWLLVVATKRETDTAGRLRGHVIIGIPDDTSNRLEILVELRIIEPVSIRPPQVFLKAGSESQDNYQGVVIVSVDGRNEALSADDLAVTHDSALPLFLSLRSIGQANLGSSYFLGGCCLYGS